MTLLDEIAKLPDHPDCPTIFDGPVTWVHYERSRADHALARLALAAKWIPKISCPCTSCSKNTDALLAALEVKP